MDFQLETRTPIWTGDHKRQCHGLKITGLTGSIRWWYEANVRGLGGWACDPTSNTCQYEVLDDSADKNKKLAMLRKRGIINAGENEVFKAGFYKLSKDKLTACVCDACKLFGCNGWAKAFRIRVSDPDLAREDHNEHDHDRIPLIKVKGNKGYSVPFGREGIFTLKISAARDPIADRKASLPLVLALKHGALGAKTHLGYGVLKCENIANLLPKLDPAETIDAIVSDFSPPELIDRSINRDSDRIPALTDFIFTHQSALNSPIRSPLFFRYDWRNELRNFAALGSTPIESYHLRHYFCGTLASFKCYRCHEYLDMHESYGLTADETIQHLKKIRELKDHGFRQDTIEQIIDEALKVINLGKIIYRLHLPKHKIKNAGSCARYLSDKIPSYFCPNCNAKKIFGEYQKMDSTDFRGVKYGKIASHHFASRGYGNGQGAMEMRTYAWFPPVLNYFFDNAQQITRDAYKNFVISRDNQARIIEYSGGDRAQWVINLLQ